MARRAVKPSLHLLARAGPDEPMPGPSTEGAPPAYGDAELIAAIGQGDEAAFAVLYDRLSSRAFGIALRICRDHAIAEDVVVEAFVRLWRGAAGFSTARGTAVAWFGEIVRNCAFDELRRRRRRPTEVAVDDDALPPDDLDDVAERVALRDAVSALPPRQRAVLELAYFAGLTQREIARRTRLPLGTVKSLTWRGLEALRRTMERE